MYFTSEIISGFVTCLLYYFYATDLLQLLALAFMFSLLLVISITDYLYLLIPDRFQLLLFFGVVFHQMTLPTTDWPAAFISFCDLFIAVLHRTRSSWWNRGRRRQTCFRSWASLSGWNQPCSSSCWPASSQAFVFCTPTWQTVAPWSADYRSGPFSRRVCRCGALCANGFGALTPL